MLDGSPLSSSEISDATGTYASGITSATGWTSSQLSTYANSTDGSKGDIDWLWRFLVRLIVAELKRLAGVS